MSHHTRLGYHKADGAIVPWALSDTCKRYMAAVAAKRDAQKDGRPVILSLREVLRVFQEVIPKEGIALGKVKDLIIEKTGHVLCETIFGYDKFWKLFKDPMFKDDVFLESIAVDTVMVWPASEKSKRAFEMHKDHCKRFPGYIQSFSIWT